MGWGSHLWQPVCGHHPPPPSCPLPWHCWDVLCFIYFLIILYRPCELEETLSPTWDEVLIFDNQSIPLSLLSSSPPDTIKKSSLLIIFFLYFFTDPRRDIESHMGWGTHLWQGYHPRSSRKLPRKCATGVRWVLWRWLWCKYGIIGWSEVSGLKSCIELYIMWVILHIKGSNGYLLVVIMRLTEYLGSSV